LTDPDKVRSDAMQRITPCLWFDTQAEEAANFYVSLFEDAKVTDVQHLDGTPSGDNVALVFFRLAGQDYTAINGGPQFPFTEAVSFSVSCEDQDEVDRLWSSLTADGGEEGQCGWLKDRFGLSWQVIPTRMGELLSDPDPERAQRAMQAMLQMQKIDVQALEDAANGS
jgi:predicted 3-demethylubiquinone-9 3-methyltransferase (glyoxalase superfamily)